MRSRRVRASNSPKYEGGEVGEAPAGREKVDVDDVAACCTYSLQAWVCGGIHSGRTLFVIGPFIGWLENFACAANRATRVISNLASRTGNDAAFHQPQRKFSS